MSAAPSPSGRSPQSDPPAHEGPGRPFPLRSGEESLRTLVELAGDVARMGCYEFDVASGTLAWDDRMRRLLELEPGETASVEELSQRVVPTDLPAVRGAVVESLERGIDLHVDLRVVERSGATRWLTIAARPLPGPDGTIERMLGVVYDSSQVHEDRELAARALDTMPTPYGMIDRDWAIRYVNAAGRRLVGADVEPVGLSIWDVIPGRDNPAIRALLSKAMDERENMTLELPTRWGRWFEISVQPVANGVAILVYDITARREAEADAERAAERVALLAQAGSTLVQRRPLGETIEAGLDLLVPHLAAAATIYLRTGAGNGLQLVATRHEERDVQHDLHRFFAGLPVSADDPATAIGRAVLYGRTEVVGRMDQEFIHSATSDPGLRDRLLTLGETGVVAVPMISRGESIGLIGLLGLHGRLPEGPDLVLIEDIAGRIAAAIDSAQILVQVQQARQTAELVTRRLEFLAAVTDALGSTLDGVEAARRLVRMLVPSLATFAMVTLLDDDAVVSHSFGAHEDPALQATLDRYAQERLRALSEDPARLGDLLRVGSGAYRYTVSEFTARLGDGYSAAALTELSPGHVTALPILSRDRPLGIISLYASAGRGPLNDADLDAAGEVARRAGLVLDNARLYARSQSMAVTLQRSLLTEPASSRDLDVESRYLPAVADAQIGGDWYDAFRSRRSGGDAGTEASGAADATTLVIGDVMGHDTDAAALMGQLRTMVRTVAVDRAEAPSGVLRRVDRAAGMLGLDTTATAVVAEIVRAEGGHRMRWSNAGHPPPVLLDPMGRARVLDTPPDLLLGFGADAMRTDHDVELPPGSTVLMFTDGLVEGRNLPIDVGLGRLVAAAGPLAGLPLPELCDALLTTLVAPDGGQDDIALVAVRVRPAESRA